MVLTSERKISSKAIYIILGAYILIPEVLISFNEVIHTSQSHSIAICKKKNHRLKAQKQIIDRFPFVHFFSSSVVYNEFFNFVTFPGTI